jgi:hypothetical protein
MDLMLADRTSWSSSATSGCGGGVGALCESGSPSTTRASTAVTEPSGPMRHAGSPKGATSSRPAARSGSIRSRWRKMRSGRL